MHLFTSKFKRYSMYPPIKTDDLSHLHKNTKKSYKIIKGTHPSLNNESCCRNNILTIHKIKVW